MSNNKNEPSTIGPKPGYQTTEFWVTLAVMAGAMFGFPIPPEIAATVMGGIGAAYVAGRAWVKGKVQ